MKTELSPKLTKALDEGASVITLPQQLELARYEAAQLGMSLDDAVAKVQNGGLPRSPVGYELTALIENLELA